ncbi:MAG TPA: hypothetical protein ENK81_02965 [Euryarchaeota archaeon]|nr:hypothetical protein [Euryarchaeota archaeon]
MFIVIEPEECKLTRLSPIPVIEWMGIPIRLSPYSIRKTAHMRITENILENLSNKGWKLLVTRSKVSELVKYNVDTNDIYTSLIRYDIPKIYNRTISIRAKEGIRIFYRFFPNTILTGVEIRTLKTPMVYSVKSIKAYETMKVDYNKITDTAYNIATKIKEFLDNYGEYPAGKRLYDKILTVFRGATRDYFIRYVDREEKRNITKLLEDVAWFCSVFLRLRSIYSIETKVISRVIRYVESYYS